MGRTFHCSYDNLQAICSGQSKWRINALTVFDSIDVMLEHESKFPSEEDYIRMTRGDISSKEDSNDDFLSLDNLQRTFNLPKIDKCTDPANINWDEHPNDVCTHDFFKNNPKLEPSSLGINVLKDLSSLNSIWIIPTYEDTEFNWNTVFRNNIPPSNSALFIDRYMFHSEYIKSGARNIETILWRMIPSSYDGEFQALLIFDKKVIEGKDKILADAIREIDNTIRNGLKQKKYRLRIEYLAIWDSEKGNGPWKNLEQHALYNKTHDRIIYTNYYTISATKGLAATKYKNQVCVAHHDQKITFMSILNGVGQQSQRPDFIPIRSDKKMLSRFVKLLDIIANEKVICYSSTTEEPTPHIINKADLKNRILCFARD